MFKLHRHKRHHHCACYEGKKTLLNLNPGESAKIHCLGHGPGLIKHRLMEMGVIPGLIVKVERYAPLGEPIEISIGDCHLSLRKTEAKLICIEEVPASQE